ncbi:MAG: hypothetical protein ABJF04_14585 [Reichenbachiella sp.]|uniref:hypothetical protein n=1 Tax=Reichenbachiella sp. TaxID=2184521 RepID=UPI003263FF88
MMENKPVTSSHLIVFIYNSFLDPLFQNILLDYIKTLSNSKRITFHVITFEQSQYKIEKEERLKLSHELRALNINWYPMQFHTGQFLLFKKGVDFLQVAWLIARLKIAKGAKAILAFANVSGAFSYIFSRLFRMQLIIYSYEPHSEFLAELGLWDRRSLKFKLLQYFELTAGTKGEYIMTGTRHMVDRLTIEKARGQLFRAPTGIDKEKFYPIDNSGLRSELGIANRKVLFYIGKFGDLYYSHEIPRLFKLIQKRLPELFFLVITPSDLSEVSSYFGQYNIDSKDFLLLPSTFTQPEINLYINASDICLSAVPPSPSQKFRSPTKVGEYLMCGKPFLTCAGVSEDDEFASKRKTGIVLQDFSESSVNRALSEIEHILNEPHSDLQERCRNTGIEYRDKDNVISILDRILDEIYYNCKK